MMKIKSLIRVIILLSIIQLSGRAENISGLVPYFREPGAESILPDSAGFIQRWLILEPIEKPNRSNTVFTDSYLKECFNKEYYSGEFTSFPKNGEKVKVEGHTLQWRAVDSNLFNVKLFRYATNLGKPYYGVIFLVATIIDCEEDIENVRLSAGSNSASMWWLNGQEVLMLSGDRRMVKDDAVSKRLTLKKGRNILRGAIINGPGMSDFCVRFINESGGPIRNFRINYK